MHVESQPDEGVRLQKVMAASGVASRRASEELILAGKVRVNGRVVRELGTRVDPRGDLIEVKGRPIQTDTSKVTYLYNKPAGQVSSMHDEHGRDDLSDIAERIARETGGARVYNVGRLDTPTRGLLLLTNDGDLAHQLAHPSFEVRKVYVARVRGRMAPATRLQLERGIELEDGPIAADRARILDEGSGETLVELTLHSGRNRIVRRMLAAVGHPVTDLLRRRLGPITLGTLPAGRYRRLTDGELGMLMKAALRDDPRRAKKRTE